MLLVLSVYVLVALFADTAFRLPDQISVLLRTVDTVICCIFLGDFFVTCTGRKAASLF